MTFCLRLIFIYAGITVVSSETYRCLLNSTCGCSKNAAVVSRIVGGEEVKKDSWGWAVSIRNRNNHICGGSLISSTLVLTAAHCLISIKSLANLHVNVGSKYLSIIRQQRAVSKIYIHRNYDSNTFIHDIAMIQLESSINMTDPSIALVCLSRVSATQEYPSTLDSVVAIGWGVLDSEGKTPSDTLRQITLKVISNSIENCQRSINNRSIQLCAGVQGGGKGIEKSIGSQFIIILFSFQILVKAIVVVH